MKKIYFQPKTRIINADLDILMGQSALDQNKDNQDVNPSDDPYNGEFGAKGMRYWEL